MSRFAPVHLPDGSNDPSERFSVTFGRHFNTCRRSGFLYEKYRHAANSTAAMERGSALHRVIELATQAAIAHGSEVSPEDAKRARQAGISVADATAQISPDDVKVIVNEVLADSECWCPLEEHDYVREAAFRWAEHEPPIVADRVIALESLFVLDVDGVEVRAKVDRADLSADGRTVTVRDWKSARTMPTYEDIGRRRPDEGIAAKDYQLVLYALALAFGVPVRTEGCGVCGGSCLDQDVDFGGPDPRVPLTDADRLDYPCPTCRGRGHVEIREPFGVADRAQRFELAYVFPGIPDNDGKPCTRDVSLTRLELHEYLGSLQAQVAQVRHSVQTGDWPASRGSHCTECPAKPECPIPAELRTFAGTINTEAECAEAMEQLDAEKDWHSGRREEIWRFVKSLPGQRLRFGRDQVIEPGPVVDSERISDKEGMFAAIDRAVRFGEPFERGKYVKPVKSTPLKQRRLTEQELVDELRPAEGSNEEAA